MQSKYLIIGGVVLIVIIGIVMQIQSEPEIFEDIDICKGEPVCHSAKVTRIIDGDTIAVKHLTTGAPMTIRLALTDTPEVGEPLYVEAGNFAAELCPPRSIVIFDQDDGQLEKSYGRSIGAVYCSGNLLNEELLETHLAVLDTRFCEASEYGDDSWAVKFGC